MRVVFDTNVYISSVFWNGPPEELLRAAARGKVQVIVSESILDEIADVLRRSFKMDKAKTESVNAVFEGISIKVYPRKSLNIVRDKKDNHVLECAVEGECEYIVSGDKDLLVLKEFQGIKIVTPREFVRILG